MTSDHDQPPASGGPTTPRLRPRTLDLPAEEAAPEPIRTTGATADETVATAPADTTAPHQDAAADAPSSDTVSGDAPPADEPPADAPRRRGWLPAGVSMIGAGVLGAGIVLAVLGSMGLLVNPNDGLSAVDARLAGLELEVRDLASRAPAAGVDARALDEVVGRVDTLEAAVVTSRPATGDPSFSNRIAAINGEVKALAETIGTLGRRNDEAAAAARAAQTPSDATAAAVATLAQKPPAGVAVERSQVEALAARVAAVESSEKAAARGDQAVRLVLVATALKSAVERGDPFAGELAAAKALGADPAHRRARTVRGLGRADISRARAELAALAPSLRPAASAPAREGFLALAAGECREVGARPTEPGLAGSDAAAIASRVETKAAQEDIAGAQAESSAEALDHGARPGRGLAEAGAGAHGRARRQPSPRR